VKEHGRSRLEVNVKLKAQVPILLPPTPSIPSADLAQFDPTLFALNVIVKIPLPTNTAVVTPSVLTGKTKYVTPIPTATAVFRRHASAYLFVM
jgi:hypothetical protein